MTEKLIDSNPDVLGKTPVFFWNQSPVPDPDGAP